ncbi:MAG TPA: pyridoxal phosphate-dependent aminotransferase [Peptococcaceae bacterium]|nr:pyridoxal phosphate-dependent aminotransferase [Peptococcaceae bacterium]
MDLLEQKFARLGVENAPGQEVRQQVNGLELRGEKLTGVPVDFSHGDVDAFEPIPGTLDLFVEGVHSGGRQAYTEYRGRGDIREDVAQKLSRFTGQAIDADEQLIITPGTQAALFLAMAAAVGRGDKVAILEPDYFANRKMVYFLDGELVPVSLDYLGTTVGVGLDLKELEESFKAGVKVFLFSNPNNPTGAIYSADEIRGIAELANKYGVTVIADELYSRQVFDGREYIHLCSQGMDPDKLVTVIGPSKTESLSGYRLGVAFGSARLIDRMEKLQAIVSLRAPGYSQAVLKAWFNEPEGWLKERIAAHQQIRDDLLNKLRAAGLTARTTEAGSYLFVKLPKLTVSLLDFVKILRIHADVVVTPGTEFGPQFTDCFRINFSQDHKAAVAAIERLITLVERYRI